ncbi:sulfatase-like hydrolase/transferase [Paenibacillus qinlingensis]|uniref:sulfatase-like hydrolase/transferase n=1 Tax=Paenibacillus qinlingensis TaxID=1837343 RepID=UPI0015635D0A|nr:sulfatase-like hydrolase/transferase [Paenibacillus qinlingensis]NQX62262.1 sulfatase-like hydrolase/transferase [Paenibacillus qinlingensis]
MSQRPNILFVTTDQQRFDCLGIADSMHPVMTPHLDQLACEGIRFTSAYSDCPLCIPSRTSMMTGQAAYHHGVAKNGEFRIPEDSKMTMPGRLSNAGYQTHAAGKMQFIPPRNRNGFERMRLVPEDYVNFLETTEYRGLYRGHGIGGNEVYPVYNPVPIRYSSTHWTVNESIDFLRQRDSEKPFFLWTSFEAPHPPYDPPESFVRLYDGVNISSPVAADWNTSEELPEWVRTRKKSHKLDVLPPHIVSMARKHYYAQLTHIDYELGRLFGELKSQHLWDNTVVIFTSDHGEMLGDHGLFHKTCFYEPSSKVPFLLKPPKDWQGALTASTVSAAPIILADIYPTVLDFAGCLQEDDQKRDGRSLLNLTALSEDRPWIYGYMNDLDGLYMVTNGEWKYLYYVCGGSEQLFNLAQDPEERNDLSQDSSARNRDMLDTLRTLLTTKFPDLLAADADETGMLFHTRPKLTDEQLKATNPFAWRGPIRYGGQW